MSVEIQRQVASAVSKLKRKGGPLELQVVVHPSVLDRLRGEDEALFVDLNTKLKGALSFKSDPLKHVQFFSIHNTATGEMVYSSPR
jgi:ribonuclease G